MKALTHRTGAGLWTFCVFMLWGALAPVGATTPDEALEALLAEAHARMPEACSDPTIDKLSEILCQGEIRVGVRGNYPLFSSRIEGGDDRQGYDTDVARAIAARLGVTPEWVVVRAATRISTLAENGADLVVATMGHNTRRDTQARFIRPHYYSSETIIVGPRSIAVADWPDVVGRRVCTTIGNYANSHLVTQGVRLMLFEDGGRLPEALDEQVCALVSHDDSFLASYLAMPEFGARFERKFGFDQVPWGMAVARTGTDDLARALQFISQIMHRDGEFLTIAQQNKVFTSFLEAQNLLWQTPACANIAALRDPACVLSPLNATQLPTPFADEVKAVLAWSKANLGFAPDLPMLTSAAAFELFKSGIINSLILVFGALTATLVFALTIGFLAALPFWPARLASWAVISVIQSTPVILILVVSAVVATAVFTYSPAVALGSAIVALGLMNGTNASQAIGEAAGSLRREGTFGCSFSLPLLRAAVGRSRAQLLSFLVNAAKGTPIASFTGAPELLSALTDITSFAAGQVTTYSLVLIFYIAVVYVVVWGCERARRALEDRETVQ